MSGERPSPGRWTSPRPPALPVSRRQVQMSLAHEACLRGQVAEGLALVERARALAEASDDGETLVEVAGDESEILLKLGRFDQAAEAGSARRPVRP